MFKLLLGLNKKLTCRKDIHLSNNSFSYITTLSMTNNIQFKDNLFNDTQFNDPQFNDTQFNDTHFNDTQFNDTQFNDTQILMLIIFY